MRNQNRNVSSGMSRRQFVGAAGAGAAGVVGAAMMGSGVARATHPAMKGKGLNKKLLEIKLFLGLPAWLPPYGPSVLQFVHDVNEWLYDTSSNTGIRFVPVIGTTTETYPTMEDLEETVYPAPSMALPLIDEVTASDGSGAVQAVWYGSSTLLDDEPLLQLVYSSPFGFKLDEYTEYLYGYVDAEGRSGLEFLNETVRSAGYNLHGVNCTGFGEELGGYFDDPIETFVGETKTIRFLGFGGRVLKKTYPNLNIYPSLSGGQVESALKNELKFASNFVLFGPSPGVGNNIDLNGFEFSAWCADWAFWFINRSTQIPLTTPLPILNNMIYHYQYAWHQPSTVLPVYINKDVWDSLSFYEQFVIEYIGRQNFMKCAEYTDTFNRIVRSTMIGMLEEPDGFSEYAWPQNNLNSLKTNTIILYKHLAYGSGNMGLDTYYFNNPGDHTPTVSYPPTPHVLDVLKHWNKFLFDTGRLANPVWEAV